jgi:hypothetical protein
MISVRVVMPMLEVMVGGLVYRAKISFLVSNQVMLSGSRGNGMSFESKSLATAGVPRAWTPLLSNRQ